MPRLVPTAGHSDVHRVVAGGGGGERLIYSQSMSTSGSDAEYFVDSVFRLERAVANIGAIRLKPWRMTLSGYAAMRILERQPELSLAQLARRCFVRSQTMIRIVAELERRGYVERGPHHSSKRAISLTLTELGGSALNEMAEEVDKIYNTLNKIVPEVALGELHGTLRRCATEVEGEISELRAT